MKNLKINKESFKKIISTGMILVTLSNFTGCSLNSDKEESNTTGESLTVVAGNKMISVADLRLKDTKNGTIIEDVEAILVGNKLDKEVELVEIIFNSSVEAILINDELIPVDRFKLVNSKTNEEINTVDYVIVGDELVSIKDYIDVNTNNSSVNTDSKSEYVFNFSSEETTVTETEEEYEELTAEKFYALADEIYKKYSEIGLDVTKEEVTDFVMMINIDRITKDNKELVATIVGDRKIENVELNAFDVYSAVITKNNYNYCDKGLGFDSLILVNDTVFDKADKEVIINIENRIKEIFDARDNEEEFNKLLNTLLMEMLNSTEEEFNMEYGTGYSVMQVLINFIRRNFTLDKANGELIKYFISYAEEYGTSYYDNSRSTAYYSGVYNLLTDNVNCKTRTK